MPAITAAACSTVKLAGGEVVEEEQRLGALHDEVVDAHGDQVDADACRAARSRSRCFSLVPTPSVRRDQHRVAEAGGLGSNSAPKPPSPPITPGRAVARRQRLDALDQRVAGVDIDAARPRYVMLAMAAPGCIVRGTGHMSGRDGRPARGERTQP